ncbi:MAG: DNA-binding protein [Sporolactobacillus laevolacticus]|jgi:RNA polymerase sigma factor (sigma-70 family)|nr:DNA-binding protein [Sporolactobacillus laevolacticus]
MKPSSYQQTIENQFDYICKRAMEDERKDYLKYLGRLGQREASFSNIDDYIANQFSTIDPHPADFHTFTLNGHSVAVENGLLGEALQNLSDRKRDIILFYYFMDMNDAQIAELLKVNRSTVYQHRTSELAFIKKFMEGHVL